MGRRNKETKEAIMRSNMAWISYFDYITELYTSVFNWTVPDTIDTRFLEMTLFNRGGATFLMDDEMGLLSLPFAVAGKFDVYRNPIRWRAYAANGYNKMCTKDDAVLCYNNYLRKPSVYDAKRFADRLWDLDMTIDINARAQKSPILLVCDERDRLSIENLYQQYDGNKPVIYGQSGMNPNAIQVLTTGAAYVGSELYELRNQILNECITRRGISNLNYQKKERMITDEVSRSQGSILASRESPLTMRQKACEEVNKMFRNDLDTELWVEFYEDAYDLIEKAMGDDNGEVHDRTENDM